MDKLMEKLYNLIMFQLDYAELFRNPECYKDLEVMRITKYNGISNKSRWLR
jgi:hypothetical protein